MTIGQVLGLLLVIGGAWALSGWVIDRYRRRRASPRPVPLEELRANIQSRRESLRKAAATDYGRQRRNGGGVTHD